MEKRDRQKVSARERESARRKLFLFFYAFYAFCFVCEVFFHEERDLWGTRGPAGKSRADICTRAELLVCVCVIIVQNSIRIYIYINKEKIPLDLSLSSPLVVV